MCFGVQSMDSECLGRLLTGLALCGAWGCFDEFNRLAGSTLCAAAVLLGSLLAATRLSSQAATAKLGDKQASSSQTGSNKLDYRLARDTLYVIKRFMSRKPICYIFLKILNTFIKFLYSLIRC